VAPIITTRQGIVPAAAIASAVLVLAHCGGFGADGIAITDLAPQVGEIEGWAPIGTAQVFEGQNLFDLINGGAEIYHEFGFRRALSQDYGGAERRVIALEVFEMEDAAAAYGAYSFKISGKGKALELGDAAMLEDYYLNLRRGPFVVTLTGMTVDEVTVEGLVRIARVVAEKIQESGQVPPLVTDLVAGNRTPETSYYLRGELALANVAPFAAGVRFDMTDGAAARFSDHTELILRYPDAQRARQQFGVVVGELGDRAGAAIVLVVADEGVDTGDSLELLVSRFAGSAAADEH
jgi:hypothetical protein